MKAIRSIIIFSVTIFMTLGPVFAADLSKAKGTVNNIRNADPPQVSTGTKPSPVGQPVRDYKPAGPSVHPKEVPAPRSYNPRNDPDVQRGYDRHQKQHGR
jgi:hypothetical protein